VSRGPAERRRFHPAVVYPGERPPALQLVEVTGNPLEALSPEQRAQLPNLIGIGAAKCGTTALHAYLRGHPQVSAPRDKELRLFGNERWERRLPWYADQFDGAQPVRMECSPDYAMDPYVPGVPEQMAAVLPNPRFVFLVNCPVRRVLAHYTELRALTFERRELAEALADADSPYNPYLAASRYGHQLDRYRSVFGEGRVLVVDQLDLRHRRIETLREILKFAGADPDWWSEELETEPNATADKHEPNRLGRLLIDQSWLSVGTRRRVLYGTKLLRREVRTAAPDSREWDRLVELLAPDAAHFRELTGRSFDHWAV
jgi:hypothetical protein